MNDVTILASLLEKGRFEHAVVWARYVQLMQRHGRHTHNSADDGNEGASAADVPGVPRVKHVEVKAGATTVPIIPLVLMHDEETCSVPRGSLDNDSVITSAHGLPYIPGEQILEQLWRKCRAHVH